MQEMVKKVNIAGIISYLTGRGNQFIKVEQMAKTGRLTAVGSVVLSHSDLRVHG